MCVCVCVCVSVCVCECVFVSEGVCEHLKSHLTPCSQRSNLTSVRVASADGYVPGNQDSNVTSIWTCECWEGGRGGEGEMEGGREGGRGEGEMEGGREGGRDRT